jgi:hypothetical protein
MSTSENPQRTWKEIARELANEKSPRRTAELAQELNRALAEQDRKGAPMFAKDQVINLDNSA